MSDFDFMEMDLTDRIGEFGSKHFGVTIDVDDDILLEAATRLFWDHYFDSEVEL